MSECATKTMMMIGVEKEEVVSMKLVTYFAPVCDDGISDDEK